MEAWEPRNREERTWRVIATVSDIAAERSVNPAQVSLAWLEGRPAVTSVILGARNTEQLADNLGAASVELTDQERQRLDEMSAPQFPAYPYGEPGTQQRDRAIDGTA
jgi:aryl-alcohol dehydrogenase-like predicted oxidoreductase